MDKQTNPCYEEFFSMVATSDPKPIILGAMAGASSDAYIPPQINNELPRLFSTLYDSSAESLSYDDLLLKCQAVMLELGQVTEEQVKKVEELTIKQADCEFWDQFRRAK